MIETIIVDANIILRLLRNDHPTLSPKAHRLFSDAEKRKTSIYLDELIIAEVIWSLTSFYKQTKRETYEQINELLAQDWAINPRKELLLKTLETLKTRNISLVDSWILTLSDKIGHPLETFDQKLKKIKL